MKPRCETLLANAKPRKEYVTKPKDPHGARFAPRRHQASQTRRKYVVRSVNFLKLRTDKKAGLSFHNSATQAGKKSLKLYSEIQILPAIPME
jgi:hypothetical protein